MENGKNLTKSLVGIKGKVLLSAFACALSVGGVAGMENTLKEKIYNLYVKQGHISFKEMEQLSKDLADPNVQNDNDSYLRNILERFSAKDETKTQQSSQINGHEINMETQRRVMDCLQAQMVALKDEMVELKRENASLKKKDKEKKKKAEEKPLPSDVRETFLEWD